MSADPFERSAAGGPPLLPGYVPGDALIGGLGDPVRVLVACTWLAVYRRRFPVVRLKLRVLSGPHRGRATWVSQVLNLQSPGVLRRLDALCREVDRYSYDVTTDEGVRDLFLARPFRVWLSVELDNRGAQVQRIKRFEGWGVRWTDAERDAAQFFRAAWAKRQEDAPTEATWKRDASSPSSET